MRKITLLAIMVLSFNQAYAQNNWLAVEGRITDATGIVPLDAVVDFELEVWNQDDDCKIYSEEHSSVDLSNSLGYFDLKLGGGSNPSAVFQTVMSNSGSAIAGFDSSNIACSYVPNASDDIRRLKIKYTDVQPGSVQQELAQTIEIGFSQYAYQAQDAAQLAGKDANDFIQVNTSGALALTQANLETIFASSGDVTELRDLIDGSSASFGASISAGAVDSAELADDSVTSAKLADTAVMAGSYGSASQVATFTVDAQGRLTLAGNTAIVEADPNMQTLSSVEVDQLENINTTTISPAQWGYLGAMTGVAGEGDFKADGSVAMTGQLDMGGYIINNLSDPVSDQDAATKIFVTNEITSASANMLPLAGGDMIGALSMGPKGTSAGDTGSIDFKELAANGGDFVALRAPDSIPVDYTLTLPSAAPAAAQVLQSDATGNLTWIATPAGGAGEVNTASNQGVGGVGVFNLKNGLNLEFKNINAGSTKITIVNDSGNKEIDIDVNEANFDPSSIPNAPSGNIVATNVQDALNELDTDKLGSALNNGKIFIGDGINVATQRPLTGDVTMSNTGATSIASNSVTSAKIVDGAISLIKLDNTACSIDEIMRRGASSWECVAATDSVAGGILFSDGAGGYASEGGNFKWDTGADTLEVNGNIGVGVNPGSARMIIRKNSFPETLDIEGDGTLDMRMRAFGDNPTNHIPRMIGNRARGTMNSPLAVVDGDTLLSIQGAGSSDSSGSFWSAASIRVQADATPVASYVPGRLIFSTTDNVGAQNENMVIGSDGNVGIGTATPNEKLEVSGAVKAKSFITVCDAAFTQIGEGAAAFCIKQLSGIAANEAAKQCFLQEEHANICSVNQVLVAKATPYSFSTTAGSIVGDLQWSSVAKYMTINAGGDLQAPTVTLDTTTHPVLCCY